MKQDNGNRNIADRETGVGVIGAGWVSTMRHIPALKRDRRVKLSSIFSLDDERVKSIAQREGIPHIASSVDSLLKQPIDAVVICAPPQAHAELIEKALWAGKHVLCEKPLTMTAAEGKRLAGLAEEKKLVLCPAHNFLFGRAMTKARRLIEAGRLGKIVGATGLQWSSAKRPLPTWYPELPGGLFFDESPHLIYLLQAFLGELRVEDAWFSRNAPDSPPFERYEIRLRGQEAHGTISAWFGAPMSEWFIAVAGTEGAVVLDIFRDIALYFPAEKDRSPQYLIGVLLSGDRQMWGGVIKWIVSRYTKGSHLFGLEPLARGFIGAVRDGTEPPVSARQGWQVVGVIEEALRQCGQMPRASA